MCSFFPPLSLSFSFPLSKHLKVISRQFGKGALECAWMCATNHECHCGHGALHSLLFTVALKYFFLTFFFYHILNRYTCEGSRLCDVEPVFNDCSFRDWDIFLHSCDEW